METIMQYIPLAVSAILLVALGLFVSYAAMFGFDKLREALEQITNWGKDKTE